MGYSYHVTMHFFQPVDENQAEHQSWVFMTCVQSPCREAACCSSFLYKGLMESCPDQLMSLDHKDNLSLG